MQLIQTKLAKSITAAALAAVVLVTDPAGTFGSAKIRFHGLSTELLSRFTFSFNCPSTKRVTDPIIRSPARLLATKMLQSSA